MAQELLDLPSPKGSRQIVSTGTITKFPSDIDNKIQFEPSSSQLRRNDSLFVNTQRTSTMIPNKPQVTPIEDFS